MAPAQHADVGLVGLAVMGQNLALNLADHGYAVAVYNRTGSVTDAFARAHPDTPGRLVPCSTLSDLGQALRPPRIVLVLVKAGPAVDAVVDQLVQAGLGRDDLVVDCGNSLWTDTIRREKALRGPLPLLRLGRVRRRGGRALRPLAHAGRPSARHGSTSSPIWEAIAAKVDAADRRPASRRYAPGRPVTGGEPCTAYIGPNGAGPLRQDGPQRYRVRRHAADLRGLRPAAATCLAWRPRTWPTIFAEWNQGELDSFLIQITADILQQTDPVNRRRYLVDVVLDTAGQKGTGKWTSVNALDMGVPATPSPRRSSRAAQRAQGRARRRVASSCRGPSRSFRGSQKALVKRVRDALYCSQDLRVRAGFPAHGRPSASTAGSSTSGRSRRSGGAAASSARAFLEKITQAYRREPAREPAARSLLPAVQKRGQEAWRRSVALAARTALPPPAFTAALAYFDGYRTARLPARLIQAQRDYFGAHTYERVDAPRGAFFHIDWPHPDRPQRPA